MERDFLVMRVNPQESLAPGAGDDSFYEEFGLINGRVVSRTEFDDGRAYIDGKLVRFDGACELRCRYLRERWLILSTKWSVVFLDGARDFRTRLLERSAGAGTVESTWIEPEISRLRLHEVSMMYR